MELHPQLTAIRLPTISRTLSSASIGDPFALVMLMTAPFLILSVWQIRRLFITAINFHYERGSAAQRRWMLACHAGFSLQMLATAGMILLSQFPSARDPALHLTGSYSLFFGHAASILLTGYFCRCIAATGAPPPDTPQTSFGLSIDMCVRRWHLAVCITGLAIAYAIVYYMRHPLQLTHNYPFTAFMSALEVAVISAFLLYLMTFMADVYRFWAAAPGHAPSNGGSAIH